MCVTKKEEDVYTSIPFFNPKCNSQNTNTLLIKSSYNTLSYSCNNITKHKSMFNTPLFPNNNTTTNAIF